MRLLAIFSALLAFLSCSSHDPAAAGKCGVGEVQLRRSIQEVSRMKPYTGKRLGRCDLIVDDARNVSVITPEIQQSVANMMAREEAGSKN